jgi:hypothetical protein
MANIRASRPAIARNARSISPEVRASAIRCIPLGPCAPGRSDERRAEGALARISVRWGQFRWPHLSVTSASARGCRKLGSTRASLWGAVEGCAIGALESPRASITTLSRHFCFDAVETEGVIRFVMRGRAAVGSVLHNDLFAAREGDVMELIRAQETELPQALLHDEPRDHPPGGDDARSVRATPAQCRGPAERARHRHQPWAWLA